MIGRSFMFRSIVSNLSLKPEADRQLYRYWRTLRHEQVARQLGALLALLLLAVQFMIVLLPPDPVTSYNDNKGYVAQQTSSNLPQTDSLICGIIIGLLVVLALYFYVRNRQLIIEVDTLRHDHNFTDSTS